MINSWIESICATNGERAISSVLDANPQWWLGCSFCSPRWTHVAEEALHTCSAHMLLRWACLHLYHRSSAWGKRRSRPGESIKHHETVRPKKARPGCGYDAHNRTRARGVNELHYHALRLRKGTHLAAQQQQLPLRVWVRSLGASGDFSGGVASNLSQNSRDVRSRYRIFQVLQVLDPKIWMLENDYHTSCCRLCWRYPVGNRIRAVDWIASQRTCNLCH